LTTDDEPVGSLGSEAAQLLEALQDWAREAGSPGHPRHIATGSPACTYCPLCRVISAVRDNPEVREHLTAAATSLVDAVVGMLAYAGERAGSRPDDDPDEEDPDDEAGRRHDEEAD
jgi:hypothetical protein